ncbi:MULTISPECIES: hypothetical protein [Clostridium]|uniref:hypothetical protein n=1 Tax=Clostridium TaxID=1485 RepID=UPI001899B771|nr:MULTISPECIES: hypothetical protein [Clostridium]MBS5986576.1 hypothetical protein [Clostridium sp.]MDB2123848.1 hypothetical protein [Clostridium paraputrificum]MDU6875392.1 hypothetical protein [Clostridium sp.]MDU6936480.1 hypothetical protein [Clostridium sp.]
MDNIIDQLNNTIENNDYNTLEIIRDDLIEFKENLIGSLESIDPINGIDDVMEDIDLLIEKINGDMDW